MKSKLNFGILILFFVASNTIWAEDSASKKFCASEAMKGSFYSSFYSAKTLKYKFTMLYRTVDEHLGSYFKEACRKGEDLSSIVQESLSICIKTCDSNADSYTDGKMFGKKEMGREIFNECASMCNSMNSGYEGYMLGFEDAKKGQSNDCASASKDSISNLSRKVKDIQHEINTSPTNATKTISK